MKNKSREVYLELLRTKTEAEVDNLLQQLSKEELQAVLRRFVLAFNDSAEGDVR